MYKLIPLFFLLLSMVGFSQHSERPIEYIMIQKAPVFKGCEKKRTNTDKKACSINLLTKHLDDNFDSSVYKKTDLPAGQYDILVSFIVNKQGDVTEITTKGNNYKAFAHEASRLIQSIPKFIEPGYKNNQPVNVRFTIPISFVVEKEEK